MRWKQLGLGKIIWAILISTFLSVLAVNGLYEVAQPIMPHVYKLAAQMPDPINSLIRLVSLAALFLTSGLVVGAALPFFSRIPRSLIIALVFAANASYVLFFLVDRRGNDFAEDVFQILEAILLAFACTVGCALGLALTGRFRAHQVNHETSTT